MCVSVCECAAVPQNREAQNWANGCGWSGETNVERPGTEKVLLRALLCVVASRSQFNFLEMQGLAARHNNEHLCQAEL